MKSRNSRQKCREFLHVGDLVNYTFPVGRLALKPPVMDQHHNAVRRSAQRMIARLGNGILRIPGGLRASRPTVLT